jgi:hypothetical protein
MRGGSQGSVRRSLETLFGSGSATGMTDRELLDQFLGRRDEGAEAAFAALVARHGPLVWSVCRSISSDVHAAEVPPLPMAPSDFSVMRSIRILSVG